jgi:hypothetical protein
MRISILAGGVENHVRTGHAIHFLKLILRWFTYASPQRFFIQRGPVAGRIRSYASRRLPVLHTSGAASRPGKRMRPFHLR